MKKTIKKIVKKSADKPQFTAIATVMGKKYAAEGTTVSEAISKLDVGNCKGKCILSVSNGKMTRERVLMPNTAFRLFSKSRMQRDIALKNVSMLFF